MRLPKKFISFCIIGGLAAVIDLLFFNLFLYITQVFVFSRIGGILTAFMFAFVLNRNITFKSKSKRVKLQLSKFILLYAFSMTLNTLIGVWVISAFGSETLFVSNVAAIVGSLVSMNINFLGLKYWIFRV